MKYIVSYNTKFGTVAAESKNPEDLRGAYSSLRKLAENLEQSNGSSERKDSVRNNSFARSAHRRFINQRDQEGKNSQGRGHGETSRVMREIESTILPTNFFSKPRTTGETKAKLEASSSDSFTSRKVSQALGILWKKHALKRVGTRNYYSYSK